MSGTEAMEHGGVDGNQRGDTVQTGTELPGAAFKSHRTGFANIHFQSTTCPGAQLERRLEFQNQRRTNANILQAQRNPSQKVGHKPHGQQFVECYTCARLRASLGTCTARSAVAGNRDLLGPGHLREFSKFAISAGKPHAIAWAGSLMSLVPCVISVAARTCNGTSHWTLVSALESAL